MLLCAMRPIDSARECWNALEGTGSFDGLVAWCLACGYVYAGEDAFICARPWKIGGGLFEPCENPNAWLVFLAAGPKGMGVRRFVNLAPYRLEWVAFHRRGKPRVYRMDQIHSV